jgi:hypothetical protein
MVSLDLKGVAQVTQNLQRLVQPKAHVLGDALHAEGMRIMQQSLPLVPIDTGRLRSSAAVDQPVQAGSVVSVELSYGNDGPLGPAPYAAIVHFTPDPPVHHPIGQAYFLQQPFFQATAGFTQRIAASIQQGILTP